MVSFRIMRRAPVTLLLGVALAVGAGPAWPAGARHPDLDADTRTGEHPRGSAVTTDPGAPSMELALDALPRPPGIPWDRLDARAYDLVRDVVAGALVEREVRDIAFRSRPAVFEFLLDHPDFAADVARALRQGKYRLRRVGDAYEADDGRGARGWLTPVFAAPGRRLFHLSGRYAPPLLPTLSGRLVVLLDSEHVEGPDGVTYCAMRVSGFLKLDSLFTEALARVARSFSEAQVDRRVRRFFRHVAAVSRRAYDDPEGLAELVAGRPELHPELAAEFRNLIVAHLPPPWSEQQRFRLLEAAPLGDPQE
ncbi:MAG: hypothetical protein HYY95_27560 [Candidatus Rokubacteria bacterium]|nr:hypothetical protein [Candidatus Rokubacteria bacterium]MBI3109287.1 hypothetical protein [Candidatus Rokubacteria bacterium]